MQRQNPHPVDARIARDQRQANSQRRVEYAIRRHRHATGRPTPLTLTRCSSPTLIQRLAPAALDAIMLIVTLAVVGTAALLIKH